MEELSCRLQHPVSVSRLISTNNKPHNKYIFALCLARCRFNDLDGKKNGSLYNMSMSWVLAFYACVLYISLSLKWTLGISLYNMSLKWVLNSALLVLSSCQGGYVRHLDLLKLQMSGYVYL